MEDLVPSKDESLESLLELSEPEAAVELDGMESWNHLPCSTQSQKKMNMKTLLPSRVLRI